MNQTTSSRRVAIIQARMSSTRFPGKVLQPLMDLPLIVFMVERVRQARGVDHVMVATSVDASDDPLADVLTQHGIDYFRGDLHDVLDRFHQAALHARAGSVVRLTGDCPLIDADLVERALAMLAQGDFDYVTNTSPPSYPDGLDVEAFTMAALTRAWREADLDSEREHVTPYMRAPRAGMTLGNWRSQADQSHLRWTIDYPDDLAHVRSLLMAAQMRSPLDFDRFDLYRCIERSGLSMGADHVRNEGYAKSVQDEQSI